MQCEFKNTKEHARKVELGRYFRFQERHCAMLRLPGTVLPLDAIAIVSGVQLAFNLINF